MAFGQGNELDMLETALEASGLAWWWMELPSGAIFFSRNKATMVGQQPDGFFHYKHFTDLVHPDDYDRIMKDMMDHIEGKAEIYETTYRIKHADGEYRRFYDRGKIIGRKDGEVSLAGFVMDISQFDLERVTKEVKRAEKETKLQKK